MPALTHTCTHTHTLTSRRLYPTGSLVDDVIEHVKIDGLCPGPWAAHEHNAHDAGEVPAGIAAQTILLQHVPPDAAPPLPVRPRNVVQVGAHNDDGVGKPLGSGLKW